MFTLKLYKNGPLPPTGRTEVLETAGVWVNHCDGGVKEVLAFSSQVGVGDYRSFYVGGTPTPEMDAIQTGAGGNHYGWGVLENALGKTTEMFR